MHSSLGMQKKQRLREERPADATYRRLHVLTQSTLHLPDSSPAPYKLTTPAPAICH
ncbi:hypothetical protein GT037_005183 [Alternaria burnsii]|uniref:Uncharacterized protein n=1 Tax=Alternaria burnsii TaxID=1187904 RepID=A0A8H7EEL8_9PLEO|nr:uncharacterized protein GT037_005183 [Alternaria burnsii]KAF7676971.1 hypothetical protein GT037_005183 [Alternaria burnsii]